MVDVCHSWPGPGSRGSIKQHLLESLDETADQGNTEICLLVSQACNDNYQLLTV